MSGSAWESFSWTGTVRFLSRRPFFLSRKREACVALECETEMNFEGPLVKAVPEAVRNRPTPQSSLRKAVPE